MKRLTAQQKWLRTLKWLRKEFPCPKRITVKKVKDLRKREDVCGDCELKNGAYSIRVAGDTPWLVRRDTIIHEWAHSLTLTGNDTDDHGEEWSLAYGRIYRSWVKWNYGRK